MNIIKLFSVSERLTAIERYSQLHLFKSESVLEHTGFVCLFTYLLCEEMNAVSEEQIKIGEALEKAVVHDIDEVVTGDIPRPTKYYNADSKKIFDEIAHQGIKQIINELDIGTERIKKRIENNWINSKNGPEGLIIALADLSSVVYKIWEEVLVQGNKKLILQGEQVSGYINNLRDVILQPSNHLLNSRQKVIIEDIILQLQEICTEVKKLRNPMYGTLKSFE